MTKKRDAAATRQNIIEAAQAHFAQNGFDAAGLREIARSAGINVALVNRYFGSKEGLFEEAVISNSDIEGFVSGDKCSFGIRIAEKSVSKTLNDEGIEPNLAIIRSVGSPQVQGQLKEALETQTISRLSEWLGGEDSEQRAALIMAHLLGFALLHSVIGINALKPEHSKKITGRLASTLQHYVDDGL